MTFPPSHSATEITSAKKLAAATLASFVTALLILAVVVLPVEFGLDPLGTGRALGLLRTAPSYGLSDAKQALPELEPTQIGAVAVYGALFRSDQVEFVLDAYDYVEYKYHLVEGAGMVFSWSASATVTHEFHGDPDANPEDVRSYDKSDKRAANGSFAAPVTGIHGWFWENPSNEPVRIKLISSGFYSHAVEFRSDKSRKLHEMRPISELAEPQPASANPGEIKQ